MASELLSVLLPDVDWEALREEVTRSEHWDDRFARPSLLAARRLIAVYDGKDG